jgi:hypothetical protein
MRRGRPTVNPRSPMYASAASSVSGPLISSPCDGLMIAALRSRFAASTALRAGQSSSSFDSAAWKPSL